MSNRVIKTKMHILFYISRSLNCGLCKYRIVYLFSLLLFIIKRLHSTHTLWLVSAEHFYQTICAIGKPIQYDRELL